MPVASRAVVVGLMLAAVATLAGCSTARSTEGCHPSIAPVDRDATPSAVCAAAQLDDWRSRDVMGIGQQVDVQTAERMTAPLVALEPNAPALVGFDFDELLNAQEYFDHDPVPFLAEEFAQGRLLAATWHAPNPVTGGGFDDRSWADVADLLDPSTPAAASFWAEYDRVLEQARRLQDAGAAVIFKPLHEASGTWFWWGGADPATYRALFAQLQQRAWDAGVHNLLWGYAANARQSATDSDPLTLLPERIDLAGIDLYDQQVETPRNTLAVDDLATLDAVAPRVALTEVGPYRSQDGAWDPFVITTTLREEGLYAAYAMLWRDDESGGNVYQLSSLRNGTAWLASCPDGLCPLS